MKKYQELVQKFLDKGYQVDKFKDFIYKDATVFLSRKKDKF